MSKRDFNSFEHQLMSGIRTQSRHLFIGPPGVGKTAAAQAVLKKNRIRSMVNIVSTKEPVDIAGYMLPGKPRKINGVETPIVEHAPPDWAVDAALSHDEPIAIVFDEFSCAKPAQQDAMLRVINEGYVGNLRLPLDRVAMIALMNPVEMAANGFMMSLPMSNRFAHFQFEANAADFIRNFPGYWGDVPELKFGDEQIDPVVWARCRALVAGYLNKAGEHKFVAVPKEQAMWDKPWPSARTWDHASRKMAYVLVNGGKVEDAMPLMNGCVGMAAEECCTYLKNADLRDPEEVLKDEIASFDGHGKDPDKWKTNKASPFEMPKRGDVGYTLMASLAAVVAADLTPARGKALWRILDAAANQGAKDIAASACTDFFKVWRENAKSMPSVTDEAKPFVKFLQVMGQLQASPSRN